MAIDCPACGHGLRADSEWLSHCPKCGLLRSTLTAGPGKAFDGLETLRRQNYEIIIDRLAELRPLSGTRVLEIGCSKGWFLEAIQARGAIVTGVEPVRSDAEVAMRSGLTIEQGLFPEYPSDRGPYDIIIFNDVFEHLPDPATAISATADMLDPDGLAVINLPSATGAFYTMARVLDAVGVNGPFERMWQKGLPSPHLSYFSPQNLRSLVSRHSKLRELKSFSLPTVSRAGLSERLAGQGVGIPSWIVKPAVWALSFVLPVLPPDIHVAVFTKGKLFIP